MSRPFGKTLARALLLLGMLQAAVPALAQSIEYYHTDALGTPVTITDADRNVLEHREYEPYGELLSGPVTDGPGYTGHEADAATGMVYMQQRYYDPGIGRFLSVDPVTPDGNGGNFNRYRYANDNPYAFADPDGRFALVPPCNGCGERSGPVGAGGTAAGNEAGEANFAAFAARGNKTDSRYSNPPPSLNSAQSSRRTAPTEDLQNKMTSNNVIDRWIAAKAAMLIFGIQNKSNLKLYVTMKGFGRAGGVRSDSQGLVMLYSGAFDTWSHLGSVLGHEFEGHEDNLPFTNRGDTQSEVNAWQYNVDNATRFGNSTSEIAEMHRALDLYKRTLDAMEKYGQ